VKATGLEYYGVTVILMLDTQITNGSTDYIFSQGQYMKRTHSYFFVLILSALIIFLRKIDSILNPQFWAEDGTVFFADHSTAALDIAALEEISFLKCMRCGSPRH